MKLLTTTHNGIVYQFRLLESVRVVEVIKEQKHKPTYLIRIIAGKFICDCPGFWYRKSCWHSQQVKLVNQQPRITYPFADWCEEAGEMEYGNYTT